MNGKVLAHKPFNGEGQHGVRKNAHLFRTNCQQKLVPGAGKTLLLVY
jgi:hypothetical protein